MEQGSHYKVFPGEEHHERAIRLRLNWYAANITKYAERAPHKGQLIEDLIKVVDYACMWLASDNKVEMPFYVSEEQYKRLTAAVCRVGQRPMREEMMAGSKLGEALTPVGEMLAQGRGYVDQDHLRR